MRLQAEVVGDQGEHADRQLLDRHEGEDADADRGECYERDRRTSSGEETRPIEGGGEVTSGTHSPMLEQGIGMAYVPVAHAKPDTDLTIDVRGKPLLDVWSHAGDGTI